MDNGSTRAYEAPQARFILHAPAPPAYANFIGRKVLRLLLTIQGIGAFTLITLAVVFTKLRNAREVTFPQIVRELSRSGVRMLPMFLFMSLALGLVVIGQAVSWLSRVNATGFLGSIMVLVVVRELGPLLTALLVLSRSGTANVIELGTSRALGEIEALEALGIDPIHYLVLPRVVGMALSVFSLTVYFIICSLVSGYLWAFLRDVPLQPGDYFRELAHSLTWLDFAILAVKSCLFGVAIAVITCYHGLAQPLRLEEVSRATVGAIAQSVIACVILDAIFVLVYLAI